MFGKLFQTSLTGCWWGKGSRIGFVNTVFCSTLIHASKQKPKENLKKKGAKQWMSKLERAKIGTTCLNGESKSCSIWKTHFTENLTKTLTGYGQKVDFFIWPLDCVVFWTISLGMFSPFKTMVFLSKLELKWIRYHKNTKTLIKSSLHFSEKLAVFYLTLRNKLYWLGNNRDERAGRSWRIRS